MEFLVIILVLAVFVGPSAYRLYMRYKHPAQAREMEAERGRSYGRHMLGMLAPVFVLVAFLALISVTLYLLGGR